MCKAITLPAQSKLPRLLGQMAALSALIAGDGAEVFALLTDATQSELRIMFAALNDELQAVVEVRHG